MFLWMIGFLKLPINMKIDYSSCILLHFVIITKPCEVAEV